MKLTNNFTRAELIASQTAKRLGIDNDIPYALMPNLQMLAEWLQTLRDRLCDHYQRDVVIIVKSGYRSELLNKRVGGSRKSAHLKGLAADIVASGLSPYELAEFIAENMQDVPFDQVILEFDTWVHVGLCEKELKGRHQLLEAICGESLMGGKKTRYVPFEKRVPEYAFG